MEMPIFPYSVRSKCAICHTRALVDEIVFSGDRLPAPSFRMSFSVLQNLPFQKDQKIMGI